MLILETKLTFIFIKWFSFQANVNPCKFCLFCFGEIFGVFRDGKSFFFFFSSTKHTRSRRRDFNHIQSFLIAQSFSCCWMMKSFPSPFVFNPHINDDFSKRKEFPPSRWMEQRMRGRKSRETGNSIKTQLPHIKEDCAGEKEAKKFGFWLKWNQTSSNCYIKADVSFRSVHQSTAYWSIAWWAWDNQERANIFNLMNPFIRKTTSHAHAWAFLLSNQIKSFMSQQIFVGFNSVILSDCLSTESNTQAERILQSRVFIIVD